MNPIKKKKMFRQFISKVLFYLLKEQLISVIDFVIGYKKQQFQ